MKYTFQSAQLVTSEDASYSGFNVQVKDNKGQTIEHLGKSKFYVSLALVKASLKGRGLNAELLRERELIKCMDTAILDCSLHFKKAGEDFEASEFTRIYDEVSGTYVKAQAGETYQIQEDGIDVDYSKDFTLSFDETLLDKLDDILATRAVAEEAISTVIQNKVEEIVELGN